MDISKTIAEMKKDPDFAANVGMVLIHNGVVRGHRRGDRATVTGVDVTIDEARMEALRAEYETKPGIYRIVAKANAGPLQVGDDLLFLIVAGDIRENVKPVLAELLDRIKAEAVSKSEFTA